MTSEATVERMIAKMGRLDAGELLCETLVDVRERIEKGAAEADRTKREYQALRIAAALRLVLLDERPLLVEASAPFRKVRARFRIRPISPDSDSEAWFADDLLDPEDSSAAEGSNRQGVYPRVGGVQEWNRALTPDEVKRRYQRFQRRLSLEQSVGYQTLLRQPLIKYGQEVITVKDVIRFLSHVGGGVHHGTPESPHEEEIDKVCQTFRIQELPAVHASIFAVARIVVRGLQPLEAEIKGA